METIVLQSAIYPGVMLLGFALKQFGFFSLSDRALLGKIILNITLPAMLVGSFDGVQPDFWFVVALLLGLAVNGAMILLALAVSRRKSPEAQAIYTVTSAGLNGAITLPYMQTVLPAGMPYLCMFDVGDTVFTLGLTYAVAASRIGNKHGFRFSQFLRDLFSSIPFDTYLILVTLSLLHISLPTPVLTAADFIGRGNGFLAMLMVGISLDLHMDPSARKDALSVLAIRCGIATAVALAILFLLPAPLVMRRILAAAVFSAAPSVSVVYCSKLHLSPAIPGLIVPLTTLLSFVIMPLILLIT